MTTLSAKGIVTITFVSILLWLSGAKIIAQTDVPEPETFFGFKPGADRMVFDYEKLITYFQKLDEAAPRVKMIEIGTSPMARKMYIVFISSRDNIDHLENLRKINEQLAVNPEISSSERESYLTRGKVFLLTTLSMHSSEVGPSQASPLIAYDLATTKDPDKMEWLSNVVLMMVPNHNPDGMDMVVENYLKYKGTKYEGSSLPAVYHKYVGHDNNRDFVTLTQQDTKTINAIFSRSWFPQVMVEKHQMGTDGPRYYVPPSHDPISENIDPEMWNWTWVFGSGMSKDMINAGLKGVSQEYLFDNYWPGSTETCLWKNVVALLTECASVNVATPVFSEFNELSVTGKGISEYKKSINMPDPWPGGWWRLSDIVNYEIASTYSLIKTSSKYRKEILSFRTDLCKREVAAGKNTPPYFYIIPLEQHDMSEFVSLANLLDEHGIKVYRLKKDIALDNRLFKKGDLVVPLAQPFRAFLKEVMEKQIYPVRHYVPNGEVIKPYDLASWSLPLHKGLSSYEVAKPGLLHDDNYEQIRFPFTLNDKKVNSSPQLFFTANNNESFKVAFRALGTGMKVYRTREPVTIKEVLLPAGSFMIEPGSEADNILNGISVDPVSPGSEIKVKMEPLKMPRIGLVETNMHDMDAGWTRFIFDSYSIPFTVVRPGEFEKLKPAEKFDLLIFPDNPKSILMEGKYKVGTDFYPTDYPKEFAKGIGKEGFEGILKFLINGGSIISWGESVNLFSGPLTVKLSETEQEEFQLPFSNRSEYLTKEGFFCPGSLLEINLTAGNKLTMGMEEKSSGFLLGNAILTTSQPIFDADRRVIARFPDSHILLSGYIEKEEKLANQPAIVWVKKGKGQMVLFAIDPIFRASTPVTYKLLFNAILMGSEDVMP